MHFRRSSHADHPQPLQRSTEGFGDGMRGKVGVTGETIPKMLAAALAADAARPLLTWYDDANGERVELSGATLANWVAKSANLLVDGSGLAPGDPAGVRLPPHWQS